MTISSKSNDHLQGAEVHCFSRHCVFSLSKNSEIVARKLGDEDIHVHEIMHFEGKAVSLINDEYFNKLLMFLLFGSDCTRTFSGTLCYHMKQKRFNFLSFILLHVCPPRVMISWVN